jgi:hypothetical protein
MEDRITSDRFRVPMAVAARWTKSQLQQQDTRIAANFQSMSSRH